MDFSYRPSAPDAPDEDGLSSGRSFNQANSSLPGNDSFNISESELYPECPQREMQQPMSRQFLSSTLNPSARPYRPHVDQPLIECSSAPRGGHPAIDEAIEKFRALGLDNAAELLETDCHQPGPSSNQEESTPLRRREELHVVRKFGSVGNLPGQLDTPHGFCIGIQDNIVIADTNNNRISVFDVGGNFLYCFGTRGTRDGQLLNPRKISMISSVVSDEKTTVKPPLFVVCDRGPSRSRMQIFSITGDFLYKIPLEDVDIISGLTTTEDRKIIIVDSVKCVVQVLDETGLTYLWFSCRMMQEPSDVAVWKSEYYVCDFKGNCVSVFTSTGNFIRNIGSNLFQFPNGIDFSDMGDVVVGDSHGNYFHVCLLSREGKLLSDYYCQQMKVSRCCGLKLTTTGTVVTVAKSNNHVVIFDTPTVDC